MNALSAFQRYEVNEITGCWLWAGYVNDDGYARYDGQNAHRLFYIEFISSVPEGWDVDHLCKRRNCVNPDHLEAVPEIVNIVRSSARHVTIEGNQIRVCREGHLIRGANEAKAGRGRTACWLCSRGTYTGSRPPYGRRREALEAAVTSTPATF